MQAHASNGNDELNSFSAAFHTDHVDSSSSQFQDGWIISYVDILTLLLTLFVILLAMSHFSDQESDIPKNKAQHKSTVLHASTKTIPAVNNEPKKVLINSIQKALKKPEQNKPSEQPVNNAAIAIATAKQRSAEAVTTPTPKLQLNTLPASMIDALTAIMPAQLALSTFEQSHNLVLRPDSIQALSDEAKDSFTTVTVANAGQLDPNEVSLSAPTVRSNYDNILDKLKQATSGTSLEILQTQGDVNITITDDMLFPSGSETLKPDGIESLTTLAKIINDSGLQVSVEGHTDNTPINNQQFKSNWELSSARATMVTRLLIEQQVNPANIRAIGYADTRPRANNSTEEGRNRNRRVTIILHMPLSESHEQTAAL